MVYHKDTKKRARNIKFQRENVEKNILSTERGRNSTKLSLLDFFRARLWHIQVLRQKQESLPFSEQTFLDFWASCRIRTNDPEITNHVLWPTELKRRVGKQSISRRYDLIPLLRSSPGGFKGSWPYRTYPFCGCKVSARQAKKQIFTCKFAQHALILSKDK